MSNQFSAPATRSSAMEGYDLLDKIGEGGMGQVHRATQLSLGRTVAIKFLNPLTPEFGEAASLHRESRLMAASAHPHVVTIYDCGQIEGRNYLVMEFVDGVSLRSRMEPGQPWTIAQAAPVIDAVAQALAYIHDKGILHLDLKPENVLCTKDGSVKITDFGLATSQVDMRTLLDMGLVRGSLDYCSPEQRHGLPLDQRSDVFALAALSYELLTGQLPSRVYTPAAKINRSLPRAVDEVLRRALERRVEARPASVEVFRRELLRALGWRKRASGVRQLALAASMGVVLGGVALSLLQVGRWGTVEPQPPLIIADTGAHSSPFGGEDALIYPANLDGNSNLCLLRPEGGRITNLNEVDNEDVFPACSPDGRFVAFTSLRNAQSDIYLLNIETKEVKQLTNGESVARAPAWSPDGKRIAFTSQSGNEEARIYVMNADGSNPVNLSLEPAFDADPAWSPDGSQIAFVRWRKDFPRFRLFVMDADGQNAHAISSTDLHGFVYPAWSPDGTRIAYGAPDGEAIEIFVCNADGSKDWQLTTLGGENSLALWSRDGKRIVFLNSKKGSQVGTLYIMNDDGCDLKPILKAKGPKEGGRPTWRINENKGHSPSGNP